VAHQGQGPRQVTQEVGDIECDEWDDRVHGLARDGLGGPPQDRTLVRVRGRVVGLLFGDDPVLGQGEGLRTPSDYFP